MAYKDIMVYLDPTADAPERLRLAVAMAKAHGARLIGVEASSSAAFVGPWGDRALRVGPEFEAAVKEAGVVGVLVGVGRPRPCRAPSICHCVDLIIALAPRGRGARADPVRDPGRGAASPRARRC